MKRKGAGGWLQSCRRRTVQDSQGEGVGGLVVAGWLQTPAPPENSTECDPFHYCVSVTGTANKGDHHSLGKGRRIQSSPGWSCLRTHGTFRCKTPFNHRRRSLDLSINPILLL